MMTGTGDTAEILRKTDRPWESANCMSSRISDGWVDRTRVRASSPEAAVTTSNPSTDRVAARDSRDEASSSMTRMVGWPAGGRTPLSAGRNARVMAGP
jgi:hypothetical protein